jgi:hypothetical protein
MESSHGFGGHADAERNRRSDTTFNIIITRSVRPLINKLPLLTLWASQAGSNRFSRKAVTQPGRN